MTRSDFKKESRSKKEELKYPCSPRSQKWINNLLPVLESYNYNHSDIVKLVKSCDYNADKIQIEVERIMQMKLGHEQGEWEVVKPNVKNDKNTNKNQTGSYGNYPSNGKFKGKNMGKDDRNKKSLKSSPKSRLDNKTEKGDEEDEKKELFTSWASLLKREPMSSSSSNLNSTNLSSTNLSSGSNVGSGLSQPQGVESMSSLSEQTRLNSEQNRLTERMGERTGKVRPAVVMPKEFDYSESRLTFGCLEEELWAKPWSDWRQFQKPRSNRLQADVFPNFYERKSFYFDDQNAKKFDRFQQTATTSLPVTATAANTNLSSGNLAPSATNTLNSATTNMGTSTMTSNNLTAGNMGQTNLTSSNMAPAGLGSSNMTGKDGVYFSYPYSNERLQNPPGLSYYTPQPFYAFGNTSSGNVTSMWQN